MKKPNLPKPLLCWAIVRKDRPKIKLLDVYETDDVELDKKEKLIRVWIIEDKNASPLQ